MLKSPQFTRSAVIAATIVSLGASPAVARQADMPVHQSSAAVAHHTRQWTQPRTDAIGVRPADQPVAASPAPAVPLTSKPHASGGPDWLLITIGSSTLVTLLLAMAFARTKRYPAHPFRARQV
jgi:hypothetical protein